MGATPNNRYACAVNRIERRLAAANRQVGKLENSLEDAIAITYAPDVPTIDDATTGATR